jgi:hypothetical protein
MLPRHWLALTFVVAIWINSAKAQDDLAASDWFPAAVGTSWTYRLPDGKTIVKVTKHEKQDGVICARFETIEKGEVAAVQHIRVTSGAIQRMAHNGEKVEPPFLLLKVPAAKGQKWTVDSKIVERGSTVTVKGKCSTDEENVKVPAGEFKKAIRVTAELAINGEATTIKSWYAEKVGLIKQRITEGTHTNEMELEKMELPK